VARRWMRLGPGSFPARIDRNRRSLEPFDDVA
jgi:hypothetical protein